MDPPRRRSVYQQLPTDGRPLVQSVRSNKVARTLGSATDNDTYRSSRSSFVQVASLVQLRQMPGDMSRVTTGRSEAILGMAVRRALSLSELCDVVPSTLFGVFDPLGG
jgi:hypothetical protein